MEISEQDVLGIHAFDGRKQDCAADTELCVVLA